METNIYPVLAYVQILPHWKIKRLRFSLTNLCYAG